MTVALDRLLQGLLWALDRRDAGSLYRVEDARVDVRLQTLDRLDRTGAPPTQPILQPVML